MTELPTDASVPVVRGGPARVGVVMGSESDFETMRGAVEVLERFDVAHEVAVVSAHRTPERMFEYARTAKARGLRVIIAGAGGAAHLPGMIAALTTLPVLGVPVSSRALSGLDSLLSIVQMPAGVPTATFAIGAAGAHNAGLFAVQILATSDQGLALRLERHKVDLHDHALQGHARMVQNVLGTSKSEGEKGRAP